MPIIIVKRDKLFERLGKVYSEEEFKDLCFEYGIELDDVTSEKEMKESELNKKISDENLSEEILYKIEIPANRYDILCEEGLAMALMIFLSKQELPEYTYSLDPLSEKILEIRVKKETNPIRPFVVCAILRDVAFDEHSFNYNFLSLQEKLHQNIGRRRTIVAIGTHDLDSIEGPFTYEGRNPQNIDFVPLDQIKSFRGDELMEFYETDPKVKHIKPYVPIIKDSKYYPVIYDKNGVLLSLPPIINGDHSKMSAETKNVFIEITCTDKNKGLITLNSIISSFSQYCKKKFTVEPVKVIYEETGHVDITPRLLQEKFKVSLKNINQRIGININMDTCTKFLKKMGHLNKPLDDDLMEVTVPIYRADILQECDIIEDVGIAYGYNNIIVTQPKGRTVGKEDSFNKLCDNMRIEMAVCGYTEMYTLSLISKEENFTKMGLEIKKGTFVELGNAKALQFQMVRTSLIPCMLKAVYHNQKKMPLPIMFFEINDVCKITEKTDTGSMNERNLILVYAGNESKLEVVHGTLDRVMRMLEVPFSPEGYSLKPSPHESFFDRRHADIMYKDEKVGDIGVLHPTVLKNFKVEYPVCVVEMNIEKFRENTKVDGLFV